MDLQIVPAIKEICKYPVIVDPSHACFWAKWVPSLTLASVASGCDGLIIEMHPNPKKSAVDPLQPLNFKEFNSLRLKLKKLPNQLIEIFLMKNCKGLWFCGLAGSGKPLQQNIYIKNKSLLIDGDEVRKLVSKDLKYTERDRIIQINRLLGMAILCIKSNIFPIITSVYMNKKFLINVKNIKLRLLR